MVGKRLTLNEKKMLTREGLDASKYRRLKDYGNVIVVINVETREELEVKKND